MDEKPQVTANAFRPYTDEEHAETTPSQAWNTNSHYPQNLSGKSKIRWIYYALILGLAFSLTGYAAGRSMSCSFGRVLEIPSQEPQSALSEANSSNDMFVSSEETFGDIIPLIIPANGVRCPVNVKDFTHEAIETAYDAGITCGTRGCACRPNEAAAAYPKHYGNGENLFAAPSNGLKEFPIVANGDKYCTQAAGNFRVVWRLYAGQRTYRGVMEKVGNGPFTLCNPL